MTVGNVLARGVGKTPRGLTKRIGVVGVAALAVVACGSTSTSPTASRLGGQRPLQPDQLQHVDRVVAGAKNENAAAPRSWVAP